MKPLTAAEARKLTPAQARALLREIGAIAPCDLAIAPCDLKPLPVFVRLALSELRRAPA